MNEAQQQAIQAELDLYYQHDPLDEWVGGETMCFLYLLHDQGLLPSEQQAFDSEAHGRLWIEIEQLYCEDVIRRLQKHLQHLATCLPEQPAPKRAFVEVQYLVEEASAGPPLQELEVRKVIVDGKEVEAIRDQASPGAYEEHYWPIVERSDTFLDLHLIRL